ncbi:hypothetical protein SDC9_212594 [bioreactor metagenome]|uniref:Uncharacterized protein n=1 Tax=bioreactor metagenome TaxID=1076179 RepID=A0A645JNA5_9ZZZZ
MGRTGTLRLVRRAGQGVAEGASDGRGFQADRGPCIGRLHPQRGAAGRRDATGPAHHHVDGPAQQRRMRGIAGTVRGTHLRRRVSGSDADLDAAAIALAGQS